MKKDSKCVFVGGIHGIGKSSLCAYFATKRNVGHYIASELIKKFRDADSSLHKEVKDLSKNQDALLSAISLMVKDKEYLLDEHFSIRVAGAGISLVPIGTFESLGLAAIIVVTGDPEHASERIQQRDGKLIEPSVLHEMQRLEVSHGTHVAHSLGVPFKILSSPADQDFERTIDSFSVYDQAETNPKSSYLDL